MKNQKGQSLIEILLASALLIVLMPAIFAGIMTTREGRSQQKQRIDASYLLKQTYEEVRIIRERGWDLFATNGTHHPVKSGNTWELAADPETIDGFTRQVVISNVHRDETGQIAETGELDSSTKKIDITVSWNEPHSSNVQSSFYLSRYLENVAYEETLENDFLLGDTDGTNVVNNAGGEVILGAGGQGSWCNPNESIIGEVDLPKQGVANAISAIEGQIIAGTGENASGVSIAKIGLDNNNPPNASIIGDYDGYKTNDVFIEGNYAYVATDNNQKEIAIVNVTNPPFSEVGSVNLPGSVNASSIHVSGQTGFATQNGILWSFDLSNKSGSRPLLDPDGVSLAGTGTEVIVVGDYAYVSVTGNIELQIIDVSNPSNMSVIAQADVNGADGRDVAVNSTGTRSYLVTGNDGSKPEFFTINTESKSGNQPVIGSYDTSDMDPRAVIIVPGSRAVVAGYGGDQYQVLNIANDSNPNLCGSLNLGTDINDVDAVLESDGDAYSFALTKDADNELKIIEGGPGGQYSTEGTFESGIFNANYDTVFNRFEAIGTEPSSTDITYQMGVADDIDGSCAGVSFSYVGPDGTNTTFFDDVGAIPLDNDGVGFENPGQCFRYKVFFSSEDSVQTPIFEEISINYSP